MVAKGSNITKAFSVVTGTGNWKVINQIILFAFTWSLVFASLYTNVPFSLFQPGFFSFLQYLGEYGHSFQFMNLESLYPQFIFARKQTDWSVRISFLLWVQWTQAVGQYGSQISERIKERVLWGGAVGWEETGLFSGTNGFFLVVWWWWGSCYHAFLTPLSFVILYPLSGQIIF